ncbi:zinc-binding dehydrogenase [Streptomyces sp. Da 82-17]|uniref:zinc-binding dehydrogenase n=1 Tax=Streptomyces sp. Da 82-17 TaxID=3377116 RepID=UPI0038D41BCA
MRNTLSADQALDLLGLRAGQSVLVTGAAGGVGAHAVELAHTRGLHVTVLAAPADAEFLAARGADRFQPRDDALAPTAYDGVLDAAGLGAAALAAVRDGGAYVGLWPGREPEAERGIRIAALDVRADGARLAALSGLVDEGRVQARVARTYPLGAAAEAHARLAEGGLRGRIVLVP